MSDALPVTLIGGYLGAGKTTLVNQLLRNAGGLRLAILVNESGALPIDADLIEAEGDDLISIAGGCICCSFGSDLAAALSDMGRMVPRPDHVVIEASGVALPGSIALTVDLLESVRLDGIVVLADGLTIQRQIGDEYIGDTLERQLADADLIVLTKVDLLDVEARSGLQDWMAARFPGKALILAEEGRVPRDLLLGSFAPDRVSSGGAHGDADYASEVYVPARAVDAEGLAQALATGGHGILRAKGFVDDLSGRRALVQVVGQRAEVSFPDQGADPAVVCIGLKGQLDREGLARVFGCG
ncbi:MAG: GTP-binding protein [Sulfitobacter sp.]|nr:GTP-binding protein [Sulfitobacter sp.]